MSDFLEKIISYKVREVAYQMAETPQSQLQSMLSNLPATRSFKQAVSQPGGVNLIAEVKKASPSKGIIREDFDHLAIARAYTRAGAAAISVLTDREFFQGSPDFLREIRQVTNLPLLRKDFVINPYQLYQARVLGADAVLLITAILSDSELIEFQGIAEELGLDCLVEVHNADELTRAMTAGARLLGINNRDLKTFRTDLNTTFLLKKLISQPDTSVVSESGINTRADVVRLEEEGVEAMLVGEALVRHTDLEFQVRRLLGDVAGENIV